MTLARACSGQVHSSLHKLLLAVALWLALAAFGSGLAPARADSQCAIPANVCGCATCGCGGDTVQPRCPAGQVPYDDYCLPACPDGWLRYPGYPGLCTPPCQHGCPDGYEQVPLPQCPEGYHRDIQSLDDCAPDLSMAPVELHVVNACPDGMVMSPNTYQCVPECPPGTYLDARGLCQSNYLNSCPPGFGRDPQTGQCVPPGLWPPGYEWICLPACPAGMVRDIYHPTRCLPPPPSCAEGEELWNGRCVPFCEPGTQRDPYGYCAPERCPDGSYPNLRGQCVDQGCPPGYDTLQGQCVPPCEQGTVRDENGRCGPPDEGCPEGSDTFRGQCVPPCGQGYVRDRQTGACLPPPDSGCRQGQEKVRGQCVPICPTGQIRDAKGRCLTPGCPKGTESYNGQCLPQCRPGLVRQQNGRCGCPAGEDFVNGRCLPPCDQGLVRDKNGRCMPPSCPEGTERFRGRCLPYCPDSMVRDNRGRCMCPQGTRPSAKGICEKIVYERPCPDGFHKDGDGNCVPDRRLQSQCPDGYHFSKRRQTCVRDKEDNGQQQGDTPQQRLPKLDINPNTLQLLQPQRQKGNNDDAGPNIQQFCPKGYVRDGEGNCVKG